MEPGATREQPSGPLGDGSRRSWLSRGEWATLLGMALCVLGSALTWEKRPPLALGSIGTIYLQRGPAYVTGYDVMMGRLSAGWLVVLAATTCAAFLLWEPSGRARPVAKAVRIALSAGVCAVALLNVGPYPGPIAALIGGILLCVGALLRER